MREGGWGLRLAKLRLYTTGRNKSLRKGQDVPEIVAACTCVRVWLYVPLGGGCQGVVRAWGFD